MSELTQFVVGFQKSLRIEMETMRSQMRSFEFPLFNGRAQNPDLGEITDRYNYQFSHTGSTDKLNPDQEYTLRHEGCEYLIRVTAVNVDALQLQCAERIPINAKGHTLVIDPWFLYEKLLDALTSLSPEQNIDNALRLFGRLPTTPLNLSPQLDHGELNESQQRAIALCCQKNPTLVWGPPGTGKTRTLGALLAELLHQGKRILVTSTTNAAVDQALGQLSEHPVGRTFYDRHLVVRLGQSVHSAPETALQEVVAALDSKSRDRLEAIEDRLVYLNKAIHIARDVLDLLERALTESQLNLFAESIPTPRIIPSLRSIFSPRRGSQLSTLPPELLVLKISTRLQRLIRLRKLYGARGQTEKLAQRKKEQQAFSEARLVYSTLANTYLHPLMRDAYFDVVIVEEASMAVLPTLFYSACMAKEQVIIVGDPKQLPPIVQSRDVYVQKALGRCIFSIAAPKPLSAENVALLDTQYRMHPTIGHLISQLFYNGSLQSATTEQTHGEQTEKAPFPGHPLVLIDTLGKTQCDQRGHHSRGNELSAQCCVELVRTALKDDLHSVGVITPYVEQSRLTRDLLRREGLLGKSIECSTVHRFQGREKDLVILDLVDTAPFPPGKLLADQTADSNAARFLNVSLSRARGKLVIIADCGYFLQRIPQSALGLFLTRATQVGMVTTPENILRGFS